MQEVDSKQPDPAALRQTFASFPTGVVAVCTADDSGVPKGLIVSTFTPVSLTPPLVSICIQKSSTTWPHIRSAKLLGVSVLAECHSEVCTQFSKKATERFTGFTWQEGEGGALFVPGSSAYFECSRYEEIEAGDHLIVLLDIRRMARTPATNPLVIHDRIFSRVNPIAESGVGS